MQGSSAPTIASGAVAKLIAALPSLGLDPPTVCRAAGFDIGLCRDVDARVPLSTLHALWEVVIAGARRADLALAVASRYVPGDYGLMGFVAMASPSVAEALEQLERFLCLWTDEPGCRVHGEGRIVVRYRTPMVDRPGLRRANEAMLAEILHAGRYLTKKPIAPREVTFQHPAPERSGRDAFDSFFGVPVRWEAAATVMTLAPEDLALPLAPLDPLLGDFLRKLAGAALTSHGEHSSLLAGVRRLVAEELQRGLPRIEVVARRMGVSERTLRRRLREEGTSFRSVIDQTRADVAESYMRDRRLSLSEVSFLLGFSEASAFARAFKRWTDSTPGAWRQGLARPRAAGHGTDPPPDAESRAVGQR
jgi:AraC-like DNA-binding protein